MMRSIRRIMTKNQLRPPRLLQMIRGSVEPPTPMASPEFKALEAELHRVMSNVVVPPAAPLPISPPDTEMSDSSSSENSPTQQTHTVVASPSSDNIPKHPGIPKWAEISGLDPLQKEFALHFTREMMKPLTYKFVSECMARRAGDQKRNGWDGFYGLAN
jgi:hypothetical protein